MKIEDIHCPHHDRLGACLLCVMMFMKMCVEANNSQANNNNKTYKPIKLDSDNESNVRETIKKAN